MTQRLNVPTDVGSLSDQDKFWERSSFNFGDGWCARAREVADLQCGRNQQLLETTQRADKRAASDASSRRGSRLPLVKSHRYGLDLPGICITWIAVLVLLYPPCAAFAHYKRMHSAWWLRLL